MNDICATCPMGDSKATIGKDDISSINFHEMCREALAAVDDLVGCGAQRASADHHAA
jgi:hypothetical protein